MEGSAPGIMGEPRPMANARLWWRTVRPVAYPASIIPVLFGIALAWDEGFPIRFGLAFLTLVGAVAIHTASNLLSDYFDFRTGLDRPGTHGGSGVLVERLLKPGDVLWAAFVSFLVAGAAAAILVLHAGMTLLWLVIAGFIAGVGYSVPSIGYKYRALGDVAVFTAFSLGITMGSYYIQTQSFAADALLSAIAFGFLVVSILHANNMRDMEDDQSAGLRSTAVRLGVTGSKVYFVMLLAGAYVLLIAAVAFASLSSGALAVLIVVPMAWRLARDVWRSPIGWQAVVAHTVERSAMHALFFGVALLWGIVAWKLLIEM